jgi:hypothetical protein
LWRGGSLNLLAFQIHRILALIDEDYKKARDSFGRRDAFFNAMRFSTLHESWQDFMIFIIGDEPDG